MKTKQQDRNKVNRRDFLRLATLAGGGALLAACGAPTATEKPAEQPTAAAEQPTATTAEQPTPAGVIVNPEVTGDQVKISWWNQFSTPTCQEWFPKIVKDFEDKNPNIKVAFEITGGPPGGGNFTEVLLARIAAGNPPDACTVWDPPSGYGARGAFMAIDELMSGAKNAKKDGFVENVLKTCQFKGATYGLPASAGPGNEFINVKLFQDKNLSTKREDMPKTWDEYKALSAKFTKWEGDNLALAGGIPWAAGWLYPLWIQLNGGLWFDSQNLQYKLDSDQNAQWLDYWVKWLDEQYNGDIEKLNTQASWGDVYPNSAYQLGRIAIQESGSWACTDAQIPFEWEIFKFPVGPSGSKQLADFWPNWFAMPKGSPHPQEAFLFIEHMCTEGWVTWYVEAIMDIPAWKNFPRENVNKTLAKNIGPDRAKEINNFFLDYLNDAGEFWSSPIDAFASDTLGQTVDAVLHKTKTPQAALAEAQKVIQAKLEETMKA